MKPLRLTVEYYGNNKYWVVLIKTRDAANARKRIYL